MSHAAISKSILRPCSGLSTRVQSQKWVPGPFRELSISPMTTRRSKAPVQPPLYSQHETFTHGGNYWRDNYLLERWKNCQQPVVYLGDIYRNYELRLRLGDWCWLTKDPTSGEPLTIKFLSRPTGKELYLCQFVKEHCSSPFVSTIVDNFKIPHHLANTDPEYATIEFDAIVYPTTGTDLRRISDPGESLDDPNIPLPLHRRIQCIRDLILGVHDLHKIGIAHADIHPGNVALHRRSRSAIEQYLAAHQPLIHEIRRKDGMPLHPNIPKSVTEPVDIGFGEGHSTLLDLGHAFRVIDGGSYNRMHFPLGTPLPPELLGECATTDLPLKVDSWQLGLCIYHILTDGASFIQLGLGQTDESIQRQYAEQYAALSDDGSEVNEFIPDSVRERFQPFLLSLLCRDPANRPSVEELTRSEWLMNGDRY